jgi:hypothetical protein
MENISTARPEWQCTEVPADVPDRDGKSRSGTERVLPNVDGRVALERTEQAS